MSGASGELRVVDAGTVGAARSQSLWHGIAEAMAPGDPPVLSFCRPAEAYVCLGYHGPLADLDLEACRRLGVPVIRRQIGGGPVWIDADQLFFQLTLPAGRAPAAVGRLYAELLAPAVEAFRALGLDARLSGTNDIAVGGAGGRRRGGERKVSGTGAGRIGEAVTVVGNVIFRFPHRRMVEVLALPTPALRRACRRLMERHVTSLAAEGFGAVTDDDARAALRAAYARALGPRVRPDAPTAAEQAAAERWEARFADPDWLAGPPPPRITPERRAVKIRDGVFFRFASTPSAERGPA